MQKHYLLLAHDQPDHVLRLVRRLDDGESTFWVHLDARVAIGPWCGVLDHPKVQLDEPRVICIWGTWSMVEAQLAQLRACLTSREPGGHVIMLSGQSYPVKSPAHIDYYLSAHPSAIHMDVWDLTERWPDNFRDRLDYFCIPMSEAKGNIRLLRPRGEMSARELVGWTRRLLRDVGPRRTAAVLGTIGQARPDVADRFVGGSQWWALPWGVARGLVSHHELHPEFSEFARWSQFPDETFFQTLLVTMNAALREDATPSLTHVDWTEGDWDLPRIMGTRDVETLLNLPDHVLFARKFVTPASDDAREALDASLDRGELP